jgi:FixJ family two-component response regulator
MKKLTAINNLIPVLFLSCHNDKKVIDTAFKLGARDFLYKYNFTHLSILTDKIQAILLGGNIDGLAPAEL